MDREFFSGERSLAVDMLRGPVAGSIRLFKRLVILGLFVAGASALFLCAVVACLVGKSHFPMAETLTIGAGCWALWALLRAVL